MFKQVFSFLKNPFADSLRNVQLITLGRLFSILINDMFSKGKIRSLIL